MFQTKSSVHINPKFRQQQVPEAPKVHINPNFAARPLPKIPDSAKPSENKQLYVNPSFLV
jgi:hypothetical protein